MSKLDEIKNRVARYKNIDQWRHSIELALQNRNEIDQATSDIDKNSVSDLEYLLSRLQIAETALEQVANAPAREIMRKYAEQALQQIRSE